MIEVKPEAAVAAVEGNDISKAFGAVQALDKASFQANFGEVHALVGENGAGKSTMIKILSGLLQSDSGTIEVDGRQVAIGNPQVAEKLGLGTVFQELTLMPWMTVAENLLLRHEPHGPFGLIRRGKIGSRAEEILADLGVFTIDPMEQVANLSLAQQQIIEIAHAVLRNPRILFMDEPTSSLAEREVEWLFDLIHKLRDQGKCIVFTSHRWKEIQTIADRITVFRNGTDVGTFTHLDENRAVTLMTGRSVDVMYPPVPESVSEQVAMEVRGLNAEGIKDISFTIRKGEILGVGGLAGHGHRELFMALFGVQRSTSGQVLIGGKRVTIASPRDAIRAGLGIALIPEDRKREGLLLPMTIRDNLTLAILDRISVMGVINGQKEKQFSDEVVRELQVRTNTTRRAVGTLSGGNQQKVLVGRWLLADSKILLLYDITRGVDIATKHDMYALMQKLASEGRSILFYSSDTEEIARLSHRVIVLREGELSAQLDGPNIDPEAIVAAAIRENVRE